MLTFVLKLHPNGVNGDRDSSASLHVAVRTSHPQVSTNVYFGVRVVEDRTTSDNILTQCKRICHPGAQETEFLLDDFLSHEVVKASQAKLLYLLFHVDVSYQLGEGWEYVKTEHTLSQLRDDQNLCST